MWPVKCSRGDVALARALSEHLWAEARARYQSGEQWHLSDPGLRDAEREEQDARYRPDPWEQTIAEWLAQPSSVGHKATLGISTTDVLDALKLDVGRRDNGHCARVGAVLRRLGWQPGHPETRNGARVRLYRPYGTGGEHDLAQGCVALPEPELPDEDSFPSSLFDTAE
jgi:predicted P-loop ATPase